MAAWKLLRGGDVRVLMPAGANITDTFVPVKLASNAVSPAGDGETLWGVAVTEAASGDLVPVIVDNAVFQVQAASGVDLAPGAVVYLAASYEVDAGASGDVSAGVVVDRDPTRAGLVNILITPAALERTTHT